MPPTFGHFWNLRYKILVNCLFLLIASLQTVLNFQLLRTLHLFIFKHLLSALQSGWPLQIQGAVLSRFPSCGDLGCFHPGGLPSKGLYDYFTHEESRKVYSGAYIFQPRSCKHHFHSQHICQNQIHGFQQKCLEQHVWGLGRGESLMAIQRAQLSLPQLTLLFTKRLFAPLL